jgi:hypothetical protein
LSLPVAFAPCRTRTYRPNCGLRAQASVAGERPLGPAGMMLPCTVRSQPPVLDQPPAILPEVFRLPAPGRSVDHVGTQCGSARSGAKSHSTPRGAQPASPRAASIRLLSSMMLVFSVPVQHLSRSTDTIAGAGPGIQRHLCGGLLDSPAWRRPGILRGGAWRTGTWLRGATVRSNTLDRARAV